MDELNLMTKMTEAQKSAFQSEMNRVRKDRTTGLMLTLFLGGLGIHHFYMGKTGLGVAYLLFCWTLIPLFASFIELFLIMGRVDSYNSSQAEQIAVRVKNLI